MPVWTAATTLILVLAGCAATPSVTTLPTGVAQVTPSVDAGSPGPSTIATDGAPTPIGSEPAPTRPAGRPGLVVRLTSCSDVCVFEPGTIVLDDGRVIWWGGSQQHVRRLTTEGLGWVRDRLDSTGLFAADLRVFATQVPGTEVQPRGGTTHEFQLERGNRRVRVVSGDPADFASEPGKWIVPPSMAILAGLVGQLRDPEAWVPPEMWAAGAERFVPDALLLVTYLTPDQPRPELMVDADAVRWPFGPIDATGAGYLLNGQPVEGSRCLAVGMGDAVKIADAEAAASSRARALEVPLFALDYGWRRANGFLSVETRWLLPYQPLDCTGALAW